VVQDEDILNCQFSPGKGRLPFGIIKTQNGIEPDPKLRHVVFSIVKQRVVLNRTSKIIALVEKNQGRFKGKENMTKEKVDRILNRVCFYLGYVEHDGKFLRARYICAPVLEFGYLQSILSDDELQSFMIGLKNAGYPPIISKRKRKSDGNTNTNPPDIRQKRSRNPLYAKNKSLSNSDREVRASSISESEGKRGRAKNGSFNYRII